MVNVLFESVANIYAGQCFLAGYFNRSPTCGYAHTHVGATVPLVQSLPRKLPRMKGVCPKMALGGINDCGHATP